MDHGSDSEKDRSGARMIVTDAGAKPVVHGGLVEINYQGKPVRSAPTSDPARPNDLSMAYSLLPCRT
jgi:hypothetical protein